jgi:hypothetical protein
MKDIIINDKTIVKARCDAPLGQCSKIKYAVTNGLHFEDKQNVEIVVASDELAKETSKVFCQICAMCKGKESH